MRPANTNTDATGYFCSECGSASVSTQVVAGTASCSACGWSGRIEELAAFHFSHGMGAPDAVSQAFFNDLRGLLARHFAPPFVAFLSKWGFIGDTSPAVMQKQLARYVGACAVAIGKTIIEVRQSLEKERHEHGN